MIPQIGDQVIVLVDPAVNNGHDDAPGVITRVNGDTLSSPWGECCSVNAKAILDSAGADQWLISALLCRDETSAREALAAQPGIRALFAKTDEIR